MYIRETFINETGNYFFGETDWYEAFTDDLSKLYKDLKSEYGNARNMFIDTDKGPVKIGWVFTGKARYEDTGESYKRSVWVEVSATEPQKQIVNINSPWK